MSKTEETLLPWEKLGITTLPVPSIHSALDIAWGMVVKITLCLMGDTGIAKTPLVHQWVAAKNGFIRVLNFGHMSPEEISMAMFTDDASEFDFVPPRWFVELNQKAEELGCAVLFLDEWNRGDKQIVNALFTLCDERRIHNYHLHPNVLVVAAMNPSESGYSVNSAEKDPAIRKRLNFIYVTPDLASWLAHARASDFHPLVPDFVQAQANLFYDTAARDVGKAFACPANWEKVSNICKSAEKTKGGLTAPVVLTMIAGQIGYVAAQKFVGYIFDKNSIMHASEVINYYLKPKNQGGRAGRLRMAELLGCKINGDGTMEKIPGKNIRADVLANLNESIALTLYSEQPDPETIAENIAMYLVDLPPDLFQSFVSEYMRKYTQTAKDGKNYTAALSSFFNKNPRYIAKMRAVEEARKKIAGATQ